MKHILCTAAFLLWLPVLSQAREPSAVKEIKVVRVGSSSFSPILIEDTRAIVEASGKYKLICDEKVDQAGYTRLDQFITQPGLFEEWCEKQIPRIEAGGYDFVIFQTIDWLSLTPKQQVELCTKVLPTVVKRIHETGARVILYDKYLPIQYRQRDPKAQSWCLRYPEGYTLNYLLHIMAAKHADADGISFGGEVVTKLWQEEHFASLSFIYCDSGHPGPLANYISAVNLAFLLTGEDPVGNPVRVLPLSEMRANAFAKLLESSRPQDHVLHKENKHRIGVEQITLTDEEARVMQEATMTNQRKWADVLKATLRSESELADVMKEIRRIQGEMDKFEQYGLDAGTIENFKLKYAPPAKPGELPPAQIKTILYQIVCIDYADTKIRKYCRHYLAREDYDAAREEYARFWQENNSKLRDDIYYGCRVLHEKAIRKGEREEARRLKQSVEMIRYVLSLRAYRIVLEKASDKHRKMILSDYDIHGIFHGYSPKFAEYQNEHHNDQAKLFRAWDIYVKIWSNPELMDKLRDGSYPIEVFFEADKEFERRIAK